jgi:hypothetical protein
MKLLQIAFLVFVYLFSQEGYPDPVFKGSKQSQIRQNLEAERNELTPIANDVELEELKAQGHLVKIPETIGLKIDPRLEEKYRYVRPWTARFLVVFGKKFHQRFRSEVQVNSAVRTIERQKVIAFVEDNKNAAAITGELRSSHLTGSTVDIAKLPLTRDQKRWIRSQLAKLEHGKKGEVTEEFNQAVFHFMVYKQYDQQQTLVAMQ